MMHKRTLPRNVDGRIKIGPFTLKNFLKWLPIPLLLVALLINKFSEGLLIIVMFSITLSSIPFMEFKHKQTGIDFIKELILYDFRSLLAEFFPKHIKHKEIYFERSEFDDSVIQKFTFNEKVHNIKKKNQAFNREKE